MEQNEIYAALPGVLLPWYEKNARDLPWRHTKEPYRVWVSEIMLQQTRVEAVIGYYERFMEAFPTVQALAEADEARVLKLWEGLGYYSRARNLQKTAKLLTETQNGTFPDTAEALEKLPGIGAYTAGAVASICFEQPAAAVDGNVLRIIMRMTADDRPIDLPQVKKRDRGGALQGLPERALRRVHAGAHGARRVCLYAEKPQVRSLRHAELLPCV